MKFKVIFTLLIIFYINNKTNTDTIKNIKLNIPFPQKQYGLLSCKLDSFRYALTLLIDDVPKISWFIEKISVKKTQFIKKIDNLNYEIDDPLSYMLGSINGQQARFDSNRKLFLQLNDSFIYSVWNVNNELDNNFLECQYHKTIGFGLDNRLLSRFFDSFLKEKGINLDFIKVHGMTKGSIKKLFVKMIDNGEIIVCNGIVNGYKKPRVFEFKIKESNNYYRWKEASHSYVIVGYNINNNTFLIVDNFGKLNNPYKPDIYYLDFEILYKDISLIEKDFLDYSYTLSKIIDN